MLSSSLVADQDGAVTNAFAAASLTAYDFLVLVASALSGTVNQVIIYKCSPVTSLQSLHHDAALLSLVKTRDSNRAPKTPYTESRQMRRRSKRIAMVRSDSNAARVSPSHRV